MNRYGVGITVVAAAVFAVGAQGSVIITEIMYNAAGDGTWGDGATSPNCSEWVEIYNTGTTTVDISGWRIDDEDATNWSPLPAGSALAPGEAAVITDLQEAAFRSFWGVPAGLKVFPVTWAALANSGSPTNEVLVLRDNTDTVVDTANYENNTNGWPPSTDGRSIYLTNTELDNNVGANWALSVKDTNGAWSPAVSVAPFRGTNDGTGNVGSPGYVPEPSSLLLILAAGAGSLLRRRAA